MWIKEDWKQSFYIIYYSGFCTYGWNWTLCAKVTSYMLWICKQRVKSKWKVLTTIILTKAGPGELALGHVKGYWKQWEPWCSFKKQAARSSATNLAIAVCCCNGPAPLMLPKVLTWGSQVLPASAPALLGELLPQPELLESIRISFIFPTESQGIGEIVRVDKNTC